MRTAAGNWAWTGLSRLLAATLAALCALGLTLAIAPPAHATIVYNNVGAFDEGTKYPLGVAVDQSNDHVYVANYYFGDPGIFEFDSSGSPVLPGPFAAGLTFAGVAVDPVNRNVYGYNAETQEIATFEPLGSELTPFTVSGGKYAFVQIATDSAGDVYYPSQAENTVQEFSPSGLLLNTFSGSSVGAFSAPQGVAVDSSGDVFVVDAGNGRVVEIAGSSGQTDPNGAQSVLDSGGSQDVAVDPVSGEVFVLDLGASGYHVLAYHTGETTPFADFGLGTIGSGQLPDHLAVDHKTGDVYVSDTGHERVWIFEPVLAPLASTEPATGVSGAEATLNGTVNPEGTQTSYHFEYGTSTGYGTSVPVPDAALGAGTQPIKVSRLLSGLEGSTTYHFRAVASTSGGVVIDGGDESFTTSAVVPLVVGESVSGVTRSDAELQALVNPERQETTYRFEYATNPQLTGATVLGNGAIPAEGQGVPVGPVDLGGGLQPGATYYYRVVAEDATGSVDGPLQSFTTIGKPLVNTGEAGSVARTSAMLSGTVNPVGAASSYRFVYIDQARYEAALAQGASDPYADGWSTLDVKLAASYQTEAAGPVSTSGLLAGTTYHYALVASNEVGESTGPDKTFTTSSGTPPMVTTAGASSVSLNTASVSGTVDTQGLDAVYGFEVGTEAGSYGPATGIGSVGAGLTETVTLSLQNLQPGVTYHYRIEASNVDGTAYGADESFTTPGFSALLTLPATAPLIAAPAIAFPIEGTTTTITKQLTNVQKLSKALKACKKDRSKSKRKSCEKTARKKYGTVAKSKKT
jgi:DNA-binding beta-propeller fold protein YncE